MEFVARKHNGCAEITNDALHGNVKHNETQAAQISIAPLIRGALLGVAGPLPLHLHDQADLGDEVSDVATSKHDLLAKGDAETAALELTPRARRSGLSRKEVYPTNVG
jgi:hypothetical protein